jgi:hypothetical protein
MRAEIADLRKHQANLQQKVDDIEQTFTVELDATSDDRDAQLAVGNRNDGYVIRWTFKRGVPKYKDELAARISEAEMLDIQRAAPEVRKLTIDRRTP